MTQKEQIRAKVEEQMNNAKAFILQSDNELNVKFGEGGLNYLTNVIAFIDSLQKEEKNIIEATITKESEVCDKHKCGQCGYFIRYKRRDGTPDNNGDCASIGMNRECYKSKNPFNLSVLILQVDSNEDACGFFRNSRTKRVKDYIKDHPKDYVQQ